VRQREVRFAPEAIADLERMAARIADAAGIEVALAYVTRIEAFCRGLDLASERGTRRDDIRPGLRILGFERRVTIALVVEERRVVVLRVLAAGMDWEASLGR
jgi:plasmid stabilization system protein ParE